MCSLTLSDFRLALQEMFPPLQQQENSPPNNFIRLLTGSRVIKVHRDALLRGPRRTKI